jgi:16S rRNA (guanine966-N2)-methyltransferase
VREAWFSILGPLEGRVLDLYAGTGALGFEALSRGAQHVTFVESAKAAQKAIQANAKTLGVTDRVTILCATVEQASQVIRKQGPYDLVVTDPPWTHLSSAEMALKRLLCADLLTDHGQIAVGHPRKTPIVLSQDTGLVIEKKRSWGDSAATFLCRASADPPL